ncbi:MAG: murein L,D-transpeptidase catalytic domain family protein [Alphaproteobacteria bacterium]|nr:murein L,D-transpeptidase catalytic domain family protein [Alphaproteobacteria bacterium]MBU6472439.1 murein L,D-transpeptidase catalytic domain family protein [Alphaproteobacteria bacterium]MDE2013818.1 murein L,D-transpeptidase catalytic domain family protein [Alphaproteobacteria bacterium]MDE2073599.1 murein L,D-transpeptidase catalytic domain family protein [Alphaproteobacteria bacterium]MDE2352285.1 murein L,D-transpeptidase catalytic domain family protein [Alphaproteobacteria bacterium
MAPRLSRRTVMAAGAASLFVGRPAAASIARMQTPAINMALLQRARAALETHRSAIAAPDRIAVIDFGLASRVPRLHLIDLERSTLRSVLVAHGRGSDPAYTGWLIRFSNTAGSDATSAGSYVTGAAYVGEHGHSMRLEGLDATNSNAQARGIVIHSAWYVNEALAVSSGKIGRSDGCFAVAPSALAAVLSHLGSGRFVYADRIGTGLRNPA